MDVKTRATIEDLYKVEGKAELVNGEIVKMPPAGDDPNVAEARFSSVCAIMPDASDAARRTQMA